MKHCKGGDPPGHQAEAPLPTPGPQTSSGRWIFGRREAGSREQPASSRVTDPSRQGLPFPALAPHHAPSFIFQLSKAKPTPVGARETRPPPTPTSRKLLPTPAPQGDSREGPRAEGRDRAGRTMTARGQLVAGGVCPPALGGGPGHTA